MVLWMRSFNRRAGVLQISDVIIIIEPVLFTNSFYSNFSIHLQAYLNARGVSGTMTNDECFYDWPTNLSGWQQSRYHVSRSSKKSSSVCGSSGAGATTRNYALEGLIYAT